MKKSWITLLVVIGLLALSVGWGISTSNQLVFLDEGVNEKWSQVENVYQRRLDLIPNLVNTVKGYAKHEAQVLEEVTRARAQVGQVRVNRVEDLQEETKRPEHGLERSISPGQKTQLPVKF